MKPSKSVISFVLRWDIKQFTIGFLVGIIISLLYNSLMYLSANSMFDETETLAEYRKYLDDLVLKNQQGLNIQETLSSQDLDVVKRKDPCSYGTNGPRILCTVFTHKKNFNSKAQYVDQTWGKRCDKTIYMSGNEQFPIRSLRFGKKNLPFLRLLTRLFERNRKAAIFAYGYRLFKCY